MAISNKIENQMKSASWIRRMFEQGIELKKKYGEENVYDFSLGNPVLDPPGCVLEKLASLCTGEPAGIHRYMPNAGHPTVRAAIAKYLSGQSGLEIEAEDVVMTCGAGGGLNVVLKALLDPGDEVVVIAPFFPEYAFYTDNHGGKLVVAESGQDFGLEREPLLEALSPKTKAVIINSPNNPTGRVYTDGELRMLSELLLQHGEKHGRVVTLISDEPYRKIVYDGVELPPVLAIYPNSILVNSHSKDLGLAGERIGYAVIGPSHADRKLLRDAMTFTNRILGFVNAPALFQFVAAECQQASVPVEHYKELRDLLCSGLDEAGIEYRRPEGAFYLFPRAPGGDEIRFSQALMEQRVLVVPGSGFGRAGYFRMSYCVTREQIEGAIPAIVEAARRFG